MTDNYSDLKEQAAIYGSYHSNTYNQLIHIVFVPQIVFAFILWLNFIGLDTPIPLPGGLSEHFVITPNLGLLLGVLMGAYYASLDVVAGGIFLTFTLVMSSVANSIFATYGATTAFLIGLALQIIGWGMQIFVGHGIFEGRKPAIFDSLFQSIVSPFFIILEIMFYFGYRRQLAAEIHTRTKGKLAALRIKKQKKTTN